MGKARTPANGTAARTDDALRAVDYLRVSTRSQTKGYGIAYTGRNTSRYIAAKGWAHVGTYIDQGVSGTLGAHARDALKRLMADARQSPRPFDMVVVHETRAIGRTGPSFWHWLSELEGLGILVAVANEDYDTSTGAGRSRLQQGAQYAIQEHRNIRSRTQGGIQEKAAEGGHPGGTPRYGYRILNVGSRGEQRLVLDDCDGGDNCSPSGPCTTRHEAPALRRARQLAVEEHGRWGRVALTLNREGFRTRSGKPWSEANIRARLMDEDLLSARFVFRKPFRAETGPDGAPVWGESLVIPLDPVFTEPEVVELRGAVARQPKAPPVLWNCYTLSGRIVSPCGKHYVGGSPAGEKSPHYVCAGKRASYAGAPVCSCPQIYATSVDAWAWEKICTLLGDERLTDLARERQREVMALLDVRIKMTGPPPPMRRGLVCPVAEWFRREGRLVPMVTDEVWSRLTGMKLFPRGATVARQKGGLAPRTVLEAFLEKARTDARWAELDAKHGSTGLRGHWRRWTDSGLWEALMNALEGCQGTPPTKPHPLPAMEMTAQVTSDAVIAVADLACPARQASGPLAPACCS
ncbi:recombinase family protein [Streptomyces sp. NBC_00091]|uniref:recombinase family protein n=1 Tax=Streptomyces sp. NBC_00091 TaxID=2975648 RepID=UPI00225B9AD7|nr:recombinase family protein [Streptomyces sp. NBC_00091]MCX5378729.1 recombinase family protein [Streptomyces sp. NBC_00091]